MTQIDRRTPDRPRPETVVRHYLPGGLEQGGGIGRLVGHIVTAPDQVGRHRVRDTRGPRWRPVRSGVALAGAMAVLIWDRLTCPARVQHIHVAGRGSTARKLLLTGLARAIGQPYLLHLHDFDYAADFLRRPAWQRRAVQRMFRAAERVIVLGARDRTTALDLLGVRPDRAVILRNAIPDPGPPGVRDDQTCRIVFLGQLGARKGVPELLAALADPAMARLPWMATLAGDGPVAAFRTDAAGLGLQTRVTIPGWISGPQSRQLCAAGHILVLPSHGEGMAMAVIEGLAHGMAVVTTPVGAHPEVLSDGQNCLFVPPGDAAALAGALGRLITDHELRLQVSRAGRALYLSQMEMGRYVRALNALYHALSTQSAQQQVAA